MSLESTLHMDRLAEPRFAFLINICTYMSVANGKYIKLRIGQLRGLGSPLAVYKS